MAHREEKFAEEVEDEGEGLRNGKLPKYSIESGKASAMFWVHSATMFCESCEPVQIMLAGCCSCSLYHHFVGDRWLCLPCFFMEEGKAYERDKYKTFDYVPGDADTPRSEIYVKVRRSKSTPNVLS